MLPDPAVVYYPAANVNVPRISFGANQAVYRLADQTLTLSVQHAYILKTGRIRRQMRLDFRKIAPDPLFPAQNSPFTSSMYVVGDFPGTGFTAAEMAQQLFSLTTVATTYNTKFLGGES